VAFSTPESAIREKSRFCVFLALRGNLVLGAGFTTGFFGMSPRCHANPLAGKSFFKLTHYPEFIRFDFLAGIINGCFL